MIGSEGIGCPKTSITNHQPTPRNVPAERRPPLFSDGSLKSRGCQFYPPQKSHRLPWRRIWSTAISKAGGTLSSRHVSSRDVRIVCPRHDQLLKTCYTARRAYVLNVPFYSADCCQSSSIYIWSCIQTGGEVLHANNTSRKTTFLVIQN
jgi:hypothetical protein